VFPIVFSINAAYTRRETALAEYASIKAHGQAIHLATRDWMSDVDADRLAALRKILENALVNIRETLASPVEQLRVNEAKVYADFDALSIFVRDRLRADGLSTSEVSRCNQYVSKMLMSFESIKHIHEYRTPISIRTFSDFFIVILPVLYAPYFAAIGADYPFPLNFVPPVVLTLVLVTLDNIQDHLENPFDQLGEDDIVFDVDSFLSRLNSG
jgi:hypothetical protein